MVAKVCAVAQDVETTREQVDESLLHPIVEQLLGRRIRGLADCRASPVPYTTFLSGRTLRLYSGMALVGDARIPWRLILKIIQPPDVARPDLTANQSWTREVEAYRSGVLDQLPGNLRAPRAVEISVDSKGSHWLWLEHVTDLYDRRWPLAAFGLAARHLGQFNGAYLTSRSIPAVSWLMADWAEQHSEPPRLVAALPLLEQLLADSRVQSAFPTPIATRARHLLRDQPRFLAILADLPQTLYHHDAAQANLLARRRAAGEIETVAIDWESLGPGTIGADLASLVFSTLRRGDFDSSDAEELERATFAGYLDGLRDAGWDGPPEQVRLGYAAAVSLRWSLLLGTLRDLVDDAVRAKAARDWRIPPDRLLCQWIPLSIALLDRADEVDRLYPII
jgi:hypothetical protein